jgi:hypothetical protein
MCAERQDRAAAVEASVLQDVRDTTMGMEDARMSTGNKNKNQ